MGNAPIQLGLKTDKQSYRHGETMTGTVYVSVSSINPTIQNYQGIRLQFMGQENTEVRVEEKSGDTTTYRTVREASSILRVEVPLTTFSSPLRKAKYEFPFEWRLPDTPLPSSFRHRVPCDRKGHCEVKYMLSAFLVPQEQGGLFGNSNKSTCASQTIHFVGAPTRSIPEPIHIAEERTMINAFCCCWKQGHVSLGFQADSMVMTPQAPCHLQIWGSNSSALPVQALRVQLIQSVKWQAGNDDYKRHTRSHNNTLVDYNIDVGHLPQWDPVLPAKQQHRDYQAANQQQPHEEAPQEPVATSFQVPPDVMDSYSGLNCTVEHTLIVSAVTRMMASTPQVSYTVHIQRTGPSSSLPVATAWMEEAEYQDITLPTDWAPDEKVPVIHLREITAAEGMAAGGNMATAQAVVMDPPMNPGVASAPVYNPAAASLYPTLASHPPTASASAYPTSKAAAYPQTDVSYLSEPAPAAYPQADATYTAATAAAAYPQADASTASTEGDSMDFARPAGMTDEIVTPTAPPMEDQMTDLQQFQNLLRQIDPNDMSTLRRVEQQICSLPACQKVLVTMTPEDYQYLCQAGTPLTISRIAFLLASELNKGGKGFRGAFLVALMQLPVAQETSISLIGSLTEQISDLEQSVDYVQQNLRPEDAEWFKQRVDDWAY